MKGLHQRFVHLIFPKGGTKYLIAEGPATVNVCVCAWGTLLTILIYHNALYNCVSSEYQQQV